MSHELRTPLNHIIGFTELVIDKNFGELNKTQEEYLTDVHDSSKHLLSLINDILDLSKVEAGKLELKLKNVDIKTLLENSMGMIKERALKNGIQLSMDLDGIPEIIRGDERKLKQIMYNLLSNAAKFTPDGGSIRLCAEKVQRPGNAVGREKWNVGESARKAFLLISVEDTGIGLNREDLDRIFTPFEQVDGSASRRYQGTGLGLSLTKSLVELHGGKIRAESQGPGKGSTFHIYIPLKPY
jgi:signal transduction histidine kinase